MNADKNHPRPTDEEIFNLQTGNDRQSISVENQHFFDITGYTLLPDILSIEQVAEACRSLDQIARSPSPSISLKRTGSSEVEMLNVIEAGGVIEDAMALTPLLHHLHGLIWGPQFRLIASRGRIRRPGSQGRLTQGGRADRRRYARYRCGLEGEFRCLLVTCLIALSDVTSEDGAFCLIPGSHKSNLPHPYAHRTLEQVPPLHDLSMTAGSAIIFTDNLSHAMKSPRFESQHWLEFQYGPSYVVTWPECESSATLLRRTAGNPVKSHLLQAPYYHPAGSQKKSR